ncbi:hypothetical protein MASR1M90_01560 [Desulfovibrionales bacterium]
MRVLEQDALVPGGVYLCQVADSVSCGGCCGLYNVRELRRDSLRAMLVERTTQFATVARTIAGIDAFAAKRLAVEGTDYPDPSLHHCPFVGLIIHPAGERVGCLLHPLATGNGGVDWRGLSFYGSAACSLFFCPTYSALAPRWKRLVREVLDDWYSYGLIIVEHRFLAGLLGELESRLGHELDNHRLGPGARAALKALLDVYLNWPFRLQGTRPGRNFFSIQDSPRPECPVPGVSPRLCTVLAELDTDPALAHQAVEFLESALEQAVRLCRQIRMF